MNTIQKIFIVILSLLPGACHYMYTSPLLWKHTSSAAFDVWIAFWIIDIFIALAILVHVVNNEGELK